MKSVKNVLILMIFVFSVSWIVAVGYTSKHAKVSVTVKYGDITHSLAKDMDEVGINEDQQQKLLQLIETHAKLAKERNGR